MVQGRATAKYLRGSPQKARLVVDLIRGKRAAEALVHTAESPTKRCAGMWRRCFVPRLPMLNRRRSRTPSVSTKTISSWSAPMRILVRR